MSSDEGPRGNPLKRRKELSDGDMDKGNGREVSHLVFYALVFSLLAYVAQMYQVHLIRKIDGFHNQIPNTTISISNPRRAGANASNASATWANSDNKSLVRLGLAQAERGLMEWQEAFINFRNEMIVSVHAAFACMVYRAPTVQPPIERGCAPPRYPHPALLRLRAFSDSPWLDSLDLG